PLCAVPGRPQGRGSVTRWSWAGAFAGDRPRLDHVGLLWNLYDRQLLWEQLGLVLEPPGLEPELVPDRLVWVRELDCRNVLERSDPALRRLLRRVQQRRQLPVHKRRPELLPAPDVHERNGQRLLRVLDP